MSIKNNLDYSQFVECNKNTVKWLELHSNPEEYDTSTTEHVIDFLKFKDFDFLDWGNWALFKEKADKWSKMLQQNVAIIDEEYGLDIKTVLDFKNGFRFVELISENSYKREGNLMSHCVASYYGKDTEIYSLRDQWNKPHCTIQKDTQIKGKGNGDISPKYIDYVVQFLEWSGMKVRDSEMKHLGYIAVDFPEYYTGKLYRGKYVLKDSILDYGECKITSSLEEARRKGKWLLNNDINISKSEEFLYIYGIKGDVYSYDESTISLPVCTTVTGGVYSHKKSTISLPVCTTVTGDVYSNGLATISLPVCTTVGGGVSSNDESTISLPVCTTVGNDVCSNGVSTISLPVCTTVGGGVYSYKKSTISLPVCTTVGGGVYSRDSSTISLPVCTTVTGGVYSCDSSTILAPLLTKSK